MTRAELWHSILADTRELVKRDARGAARQISLSPDVAERLDALVIRPAVVQEELFATAPEPKAVLPTEDRRGALEDVEAALGALRTVVSACERCGLCKTRNKTVFGEGNARAEVVFVGEAPGADEDAQGRPFVGRAGQLLTDIIEKGMKIPRESVYICNVLKCRPPDNATPNPEQVAQCEPYLRKQLALLQPRVIVALGKTAAQTLLRSEESMGRMRGKWHTYEGIPLRATYHPSYLLRKPEDKRLAWDDIKEVLRFLAEPVQP